MTSNKHRAISDLHTLVNANFTFANVSTISAKPNIRLKGTLPPDTFPSNGEIVFTKQRMGGSTEMGAYRSERYLIDGYIHYHDDDRTSDQIVNEIMAEIWRVLDENNNSISSTHEYYLDTSDYDSDHIIGIVSFVIESIRKDVAATG